ncbi:NfeD family protein [Pseudomonas sp. NPDC089569]|uniref:NfeD family protein n=1 Tax=Pseudomonas sp. NPDC089569 TaxID=3390722 RepID=UPI003D07D29B
MEMQWWYWVVLGFALAALEIFTMSFFVLWFGIGAVLVGLLCWASPELTLANQLLAWTVLSTLLVVFWFKVINKRGPDTRWTAEDVIGQIGLLTSPVSEFVKGRVRFQKPILGSEEWVCVSNSEIPSGERVRIVSVEGNTVRIEIA